MEGYNEAHLVQELVTSMVVNSSYPVLAGEPMNQAMLNEMNASMARLATPIHAHVISWINSVTQGTISVSWEQITGKPTTHAGYGITDNPSGSGLLVNGTPAINQLVIFDSASAIRGDSKLIWNGTKLTIDGSVEVTGEITAFSAGAPPASFWDSIPHRYSIEYTPTSTGFLQLLNDADTPGPNKAYGTDGAGVKGWITAGGSYTFQQSLVNNTGTVNLVGDSTTPGNSMYYGTNGSGTKGFYGIPSSMVYPAVGVAVSTGSAWTTSLATANIAMLDNANSFSATQTLAGALINGTMGMQSAGSTKWTIQSNTTPFELQFKNASNDVKATLDQAGNLFVYGDVCAFASTTTPPNWWDSMPVATNSTMGGFKLWDTQFTMTLGVLKIKDSVLIPAVHYHAWSDLTSGVPSTFPPSAHYHAWSDLTSGVPSTFTPSSHTLEGHTATVTVGKFLKGTGVNTFAWADHGLVKGDVGLGNVDNESKATMFTSPTFTGTPLVNGTLGIQSAGATKWTIVSNTTPFELLIKNAAGTTVGQLDQNGNLLCQGDITAYATGGGASLWAGMPVRYSIVYSGGYFNLDGETTATPGNDKFYGTNGSGVKGWYTVPTGTSSQWVTTGSDIYYSTGHVMIGTNTAPTSTLHVYEATNQQAAIFQSTRSGATDGAYIGLYDSTNGTNHTNVTIGSVGGHLVFNGAGANVGIGTLDVEAWNTSYKAIEFTNSAIMAGQSAIHLHNNAYYDSGGWKYKTTAVASTFKVDSGVLTYRYTASGTIDTAITWTTGFVCDTSGNFGIGIIAPTKQLHVYNPTTSADSEIRVDGLGTMKSIIGLANAGTDYGQLYFDNGTNGLYLYQKYASGNLFLGTNSTTNMTIESGGNVGIGTVAPDYKLHIVDGTWGAMVLERTGVYSSKFRLDSGYSTEGDFCITDLKDSRDVFYINSDGHVGIWTTGPTSPFSVTASKTDRAIVLFTGTGTAGTYMQLDESGIKGWAMGIDDGSQTFKIRQDSYSGSTAMFIENNNHTTFTGAVIKFGTTEGYSYFNQDTLNFRFDSNSDTLGYINYYGYNAGQTQFRDLSICDGRGTSIAYFDGSSRYVGFGVAPTRNIHVYQNSANMEMVKVGNAYYNRGVEIGTHTNNTGYIQGIVDSSDAAYTLSLNPKGGGIIMGATTAMNFHLSVYRATDTYMQFMNSGTGITNADGTIIGLDGSTLPFYIRQRENSTINLWTNDQERIVIGASGTLYSYVAGGTAPLNMTSTTVCPNLNASMVQGFGAGSLAKQYSATVYLDTTYALIAHVWGDGLAAGYKISFMGTGNSVVVNVSADILVNHYQDIAIKSVSGGYSTVTLRVTSDGNSDHYLEAKINTANSSPIVCTLIPFGTTVNVVMASGTVSGSCVLTHICEPFKECMNNYDAGIAQTSGYYTSGYMGVNVLPTGELKLGIYTSSGNSASGPVAKFGKGSWSYLGNIAYDTVVIEANDVATLRIVEGDGTQMGITAGDGSTTFAANSAMRFFTGGTGGTAIYNGMGGTQRLHIGNDGKIEISTPTSNHALVIGRAGGYSTIRGLNDICIDANSGSHVYLGNYVSSNVYLNGAGGNTYGYGEIQAYTSSDRRLKQNINYEWSGLDLIGRMKPAIYNWNNLAIDLNPQKTSYKRNYGMIADEMEHVAPDLIHVIYGKYQSIDYEQVIPILVKGMQELRKENIELREEVKQLKNN